MLTRTGGLIAAGVTYGTAKMDSTWAWRLPSALQGLFSLMCIILIPFTPESPRWLQSQGRSEEALLALAQTHSDGNTDDPAVIVQYRQIVDTLAFERSYEKAAFVKQLANSSSTRRRVFLVCTVAVFCMLSGNNIISYYFGTMLTQAGGEYPFLRKAIPFSEGLSLVALSTTIQANGVPQSPTALPSSRLTSS